ncbi:MAG: hypothetical protein HPY85_16720 [Anaerolineae bacterium]|nr:hypothetical protein [Anaerolineae bacterium]
MDEKREGLGGGLPEFHQIELEKMYEARLSMANLRGQCATFFGTANLAVISLALTVKEASLFLFAALLLWAAIILDARMQLSLLGYSFRITQLGRMYGIDGGYYSLLKPGPSMQYVRLLLDEHDPIRQRSGLRKLPFRYLDATSFWFPLSISLLEFLLGLYLWVACGWTIF